MNDWIYDVIGAAVVGSMLYENDKRIEADLLKGIEPAWWRKHLFLLIALPVIVVIGGVYLVASFAVSGGSLFFAVLVLIMLFGVGEGGYRRAEQKYAQMSAHARFLRSQQRQQSGVRLVHPDGRGNYYAGDANGDE